MKKHFLSILMFAAALSGASAQEKILWGGPGSKDGEFNGGLNGWTTVGVKSGDPTKANLAVFTWSQAANAPGGYTPVANTVLNSASKSNGAVVFNSDVLDSGTGGSKNPTSGSVFGAGVCPTPHEAELISPTINLTGQKDVTLVFSQLFRNFRSSRPRDGKATASTAILYSRDNGATWSDPVPIYVNEQCKTYQLNTNYSPTVVTRVQLPGAGNTDKFKVKFSFAGDYYFWVIDDVSIVPMENNNLRANANFYAPFENVFTPITQTRESYFLNDIANTGAKPQSNVRHTMNIYKTNASGQLIAPAVFSDTLKYGTVLTDTTIENIPFPKGFEPTGPKSNYAALYELISDSTDVEIWNNRLSAVFGITDTTFAKDNGRTRSVAPAFSGSDFTFGYGNVYYIKKGKGFDSGIMQFTIENGSDLTGDNVDVYLYKWTGDANNNKEIDEDELETAGYSAYTVKGTETSATPIRLRIDNFLNPGKAINLEDNTYYIVYVEHIGKSADEPMFLSASDRYDYAASALAFENSKKLSFYSVLKIGEELFTGGFRSLVPTIRWNIRAITSDRELILPENNVAVSPNPASDYTQINFNFSEVMNVVDVNVVDVNGRTIMTNVLRNIQSDNYRLDVSSLNAGVYSLVVRTEKGIATKSLVIQK